jgi:murein DD-endopeptidase MepM/ murein hydrolase activator NlpD
MAATGSTDKDRHLAQPPGDFRSALPGRRRLRPSNWVVAALLVVALSFLVLPVARGSAQTATLAEPATLAAAAESPAPVVPILFPLEQRISWTDTFGAARSGGRTHAGNDLMAPKMTPLLAVVDGTVDWLNLTGELSSYNSFPYYNILLRGDDGNDYFYIHLNNDTPGTDDGLGGTEYAYAPGLINGTHVHRGDLIGYVGDSGNAEDTAPHLHFEIHLGGYVSASAGQTRTPSSIDPYASLKAAPTLAEWIAAGKPPLTTTTTAPGVTTTTVPGATTTTVAPKPTTTTTTTALKPTTTTTPGAPPPATTTTTEVDTSVPGFADIRTTDWFYAGFAVARSAGVVADAADQQFRPYAQVSRALFAAYLVRAMAPGELNGGAVGAAGVGAATEGPIFKDVPATYWAYNEIQAAARLGLVRGTGDGSQYTPDAVITRAQMATMMCRAMGSDPNDSWAGAAAAAYLVYRDVPKGYWAQGAVLMVDYLGLMCGDNKGYFRPEETANRAQAITVMARVLRLLEGGSSS